MDLLVLTGYAGREICRPRLQWSALTKTLTIMKLIFIFLLAGFLQLSARGISQNVNIAGSGMSLKKVMLKIKAQTGYDFFYMKDWMKESRPVTVNLKDAPLEKALQACLENQPFSYQIYDKVIIIKQKSEKPEEKELTVEAGPDFMEITGKVTNEKNEPLAGATVSIKGARNANAVARTSVVTNAEGFFRISANKGNTLVISSVGYREMEFKVGNATVINATLDLLDKSMDEVVVIGFGTVKRRDLTGAVSSVKNDVIVKAPVPNALTALQGRVAGMDINRDANGLNVRIRGNRSIPKTNAITDRDNAKFVDYNAPLVIIDGLQGGSYADIPPSDIESIEVLKDASSTAIYGYQGGNGVIIITTKKGRTGKTKIRYNTFYGRDKRPYLPDYRTGERYIQPRREAFRTANQWSSPADDSKLFTLPQEYAAYQAGLFTNYDDLLKQDAVNQSHQITASGGNDKTTALFSATYYNQGTEYKQGKMDRFALRANVEHKISTWISSGINFQVAHTVTRLSPYSGGGVNLGSPYDSAGNIVTYPVGSSGYVNPLINDANGNNNVSNSLNTSILGNGYIDVTIIKGLTFRSQLGTSLVNVRKGSFDAAYSIDRIALGTALSSMSTYNTRNLNWDNILSYTKKLNDHNFTITGISSWTQNKREDLGASAIGQLAPNQIYYGLGSVVKANTSVAADYTQTQSSSYAGRLNYSYKGRYLLTLSERADGVSRLVQKWSAFPSAAVAWRIGDESFMNKTKSWLDDLKLRLSYGVAGNANIEPYATQSVVTPGAIGFQDLGLTYYKYGIYLGNIDLHWERSATTNLGLDFTLFNGKINTTIDAYSTRTTGILLARNVPTSMGNEGFFLYQNIGTSGNKGIEVQVNTENIKNSRIRWNSTVTFSTNKEKVIDLIDGKDIIAKEKEENSLLIGRPVKSYYTFINEGIWQTSEAAKAATVFKDAAKTQPFKPGDIKVRDLDGDNVITQDKDVTYIGSPTPKWFAGLNNTVNYKNFDLSVFVYVRYGQLNNTNPAAAYSPETGGSYTNLNYWTPENPSNDLPRPNKGGKLFDYIGYQSLTFVDNSFFKLKNVSLGYTLPQKVLNSKVNNIHFYATAANLLSVNKSHYLKYRDAEGQGRQYVVGLNLEF